MKHYQTSELKSIKKLPKHVAIIMDGNRRWAKKRGLLKPGHFEGAETVDLIVEAAEELGIQELTLYAFSTENWKRSKLEVKTLLKILDDFLLKKWQKMVKKGICFGSIGDLSAFPEKTQKNIEFVKKKTEGGKKMRLTLALNYGSRDEICRACDKIAKKMAAGEIQKVTEELFDRHLDTADLSPLDLFIRTSGEMRLSNFLLWQLSYAEIYVTDTLWPDFSPQELLRAVKNYEQRQRRVGR